ncbi:SAF domain-containing protein [Microbacterium sp. NE2HP2]|uniref:SAF domain-containing protein n=1 Tax=Microbacterium plantarum TaxID=1816425 RepID=A0ABV5EV58_9MICO|nr:MULTISPECIES: SAF domain-containing protein [Microbacterium]MDD7945053.1 SAF domain-containing protein [Microbacterium plantarum]RAZ31596.1 hypothetical protein DO944_11805 [Microbacterium sp. SMR1]WHE35445.1 SAF domain-containing protein [Microbacterium sp. BDGP8]WRK16607.1 SAF domain-containing protein [Microbacterium plantarum]
MVARTSFRNRIRRADARVIIGVVLVSISVAGVWAVVSAARQTSAVLTAARTIVVGETVEAADLRVVEVALGSADDIYAAPGALEPGGVATRTIPAGEFVPRAAVASPDDVEVTTVVVQTAGAVPGSVSPGTRVEVWSAPQRERGVFGEPRILVREATVRAVQAGDGLMAQQRSAAVELVVARTDVSAALAAVAAGDAVSVIPAAGGTR